MVTVYVIESLSDGTWYTGMALNAINRLAEHNNGKNRFTKGHRPWKIIMRSNLIDLAHDYQEEIKKGLIIVSVFSITSPCCMSSEYNVVQPASKADATILLS